MSTIDITAPVATASRRGLSRFAGIGFVAAFAAAFVLLVSGPNAYEEGSLAEFAAGYADQARETPIGLAAFILMPLAGALLIWAVVHIGGTLAGGRPSSAARVSGLGAGLMAALTVAGAGAANAGQIVTTGAGDGFPGDPGTGWALSMLADQVMTVGFAGGTVLLVALGVLGLRTGGLPGWLVWAGFVISPLLVMSYVFFMLPLLVLLVWVAVACLVAKSPAPEAAA